MQFFSREDGHRLTQRHVAKLAMKYWDEACLKPVESRCVETDGISSDHGLQLPSLADVGDFAWVQETGAEILVGEDGMSVDDSGLSATLHLGRSFPPNQDVVLF